MPPTVRVYLCRHAHAEPGSPDELRTLTMEGRARATAMGEELRAARPRPTILLTSPVRRARETAERIGDGLGLEPLIDTRLAPGATLTSLQAAVLAADGHGAVVAVGHQPDCSEIAVAVDGRDPGFPPGGIHALDLDA